MQFSENFYLSNFSCFEHFSFRCCSQQARFLGSAELCFSMQIRIFTFNFEVGAKNLVL